MKTMIATCLVLMLSGCTTLSPEQKPITTEQREFIFEYAVPAKSKTELFKAARNHFALSYGNSKEVSRLEDEEQGTIIGKAVAPWSLSLDSIIIPAMPCASNYNLIFIAKDGKARLQLTLLEGAALPLSCGWARPPKRDYPQIVSHFKSASESLSNALDNKAAIDRLKNF